MHARNVKAFHRIRFAYPQGSCAYPWDPLRLSTGCASLIIKFMIQAWQITKTQNIKLELKAFSLDEVTRQLPDPDGYYSTFRTFEGCRRVLGLAAHLQRLYGPVPAPDVSEFWLRGQLFTLLEPYRPDEARVRVMMTKQGRVYVAIEPLSPLPRQVYETGVRVETTEIQRESPQLKSTAFIAKSDSERKHIVQAGIFEALLVKDGSILEGMTSNFFYTKDNILYTAQDDILPGITRKTVIDIARGRGVVVRYETLKRDQLAAVDEAFITSSSRGIVPVIEIDKVTVGQGRPGPITKELLTAYDLYVTEKAEKIQD
jgi:branched-chain amino acid aminotransferase